MIKANVGVLVENRNLLASEVNSMGKNLNGFVGTEELMNTINAPLTGSQQGAFLVNVTDRVDAVDARWATIVKIWNANAPVDVDGVLIPQE